MLVEWCKPDVVLLLAAPRLLPLTLLLPLGPLTLPLLPAALAALVEVGALADSKGKELLRTKRWRCRDLRDSKVLKPYLGLCKVL